MIWNIDDICYCQILKWCLLKTDDSQENRYMKGFTYSGAKHKAKLDFNQRNIKNGTGISSIVA